MLFIARSPEGICSIQLLLKDSRCKVSSAWSTLHLPECPEYRNLHCKFNHGLLFAEVDGKSNP